MTTGSVFGQMFPVEYVMFSSWFKARMCAPSSLFYVFLWTCLVCYSEMDTISSYWRKPQCWSISSSRPFIKIFNRCLLWVFSLIHLIRFRDGDEKPSFPCKQRNPSSSLILSLLLSITNFSFCPFLFVLSRHHPSVLSCIPSPFNYPWHRPHKSSALSTSPSPLVLQISFSTPLFLTHTLHPRLISFHSFCFYPLTHTSFHLWYPALTHHMLFNVFSLIYICHM